MKNIFKYIALSIVMLATSACSLQELVFDHEQAAFETRDGLILIEAIMPSSTKADDVIYICGPFNGTEENVATDMSLWQLEKSATVEGKWGIYLNPSTFADGKTLLDGFWFLSTNERREVSPKHENVVHTLNAIPGERYNIYVDRWESYYDAPSVVLPQHDGTYRIYYICDNEWDPVNLYMYGDVNDLGGGWPGCAKKGTEKIADHSYSYFELTKDEASGLTEHLIFNGNGGKQQIPGEQEPVITFGSVVDFFYAVSSDESGAFTCTEIKDIENPGIEPFIPADPVFSIYVKNLTEWEQVYAYSCNHEKDPVEEALGAWPGSAPVETVTLSGEEYLRFEIKERFLDKEATLTFHNGNGTRCGGPGVTLTADMRLALAGSGFSVMDDPIVPYAVKLYVVDNTGWGALALYAWGDAEVFGAWPGASPAGSITYNEVTYKYFEFPSNYLGFGENLIFNSTDGSQLPDLAVTLAEDMFVSLSTEAAEIIEKPEMPAYLYVKDNTGWDAISVYAWGDAEIFGGWPGLAPIGKEVINEVEFTVFQFGDSAVGKSENFIFNNNGAGSQTPDLAVTVTKEMFVEVTAEGATVIDRPKDIVYVDFYVLDQTGWDGISVYAWGDAEIFGGWPGKSPVGENTWDGVTYKHFRFSDEYVGNAEHFIFNNNGGGSQTPDFDITLGGTFFVKVTTDGAELIADPRSTYSIYVQDNTGWADGLAVYGWASDQPEVFGGWPGAVPAGTVSLCGKTYKKFKVGDDFNGKAYHIIFNSCGTGSQYDGPEITFDRDHYFIANAEGCEEIDNPGCRIYVQDNTGWGTIALYTWGEEIFGGWPGRVEEGTQTIGGVNYKYFSVAPGDMGKSANPIVNNNNGGSQMDLTKIEKITEDCFLTATL